MLINVATRFNISKGVQLLRNIHMKMAKSLDELNFINGVLNHLPIDSEEENYVRTVNNACFSLVKPTPITNPKLVCHSSAALQLLDLDDGSIDDHFIRCFAGNELIEGSKTAAHCYCGHQFGEFAGQLGDGAAIYLGEIINSKNEHWELQLKGAGKTPYSRDADGRKVLRSSLREFLCSEAMHNLGIPTTRAMTCIVGDDKVERDMFYNGNPKMESCSVISRVAQSFIRFGSFEIFKPLDRNSYRSGPSVGRHDILTNMTDYIIKSYFPSINDMEVSQCEKYKLFYKNVVINTAKLAAKWQAVGFVHGVLNTDNMSILGLTIDYGPFGFMDRFDFDHIPNTSDTNGRYRFRQQPEICLWNLSKFAETLQPLVPINELKDILNETYVDLYVNEYKNIMLQKFGLFKNVNEDNDDLVSDKTLTNEFLQTMTQVGGDYTNCFRTLSSLNLPGMASFETNLETLTRELLINSSTHDELMDFYESYFNSPMVQMKLILMSNFMEQMIDEKMVLQIMARLQHRRHIEELDPEQMENENRKLWTSWLKLYVNRLKHEVVDFKDDLLKLEEHDKKRKQIMNANNPRIILRNHLAENAIKKAESGDFNEARQLLKALTEPYADIPEYDQYTRKPSKLDSNLKLSCSS